MDKYGIESSIHSASADNTKEVNIESSLPSLIS